MLHLDDALEAIRVLGQISPETTLRIALPYTGVLMQKLHESGYLPALERNAWNDMEIVISTPPFHPNKVDGTPRSE